MAPVRKRAFVHELALTLAAALAAIASAGAGSGLHDAPPPLISVSDAGALANEISGADARRTVQELTLHHRQRGSRGFAAAASAVLERARAYGLSQAEMLEFPADGKIFYGPQRSRPAWDANFAELWELRPVEGSAEAWVDDRRIASFETRPATLAEDSESGSVSADLVDAGDGTSEEDYAGKEVAGKLVLAANQPGPVAALAVAKHGAAGIVSYAPNQKTAWWKEDETLVRWGHLETFSAEPTFAFMISLQQARSFQERLARGERVRLRAEVSAGRHPGTYRIPTAAIPGSDPKLAGQEIAFSCHLDHLLPGANDNASGCAAILETGRALAKLIREGRIPPPKRTIRFYWPAEIEGTITLLNARPDLAARTLAVIHMDMVGGDAAITKAIFHVTRSPKSLPSFVNDVAEAFARFVNDQSAAFAGGEDVSFPLVDPEGGKEALQAEIADFTMGSDHHVWSEGSFRVPAIYMNDWPDRYIHTHKDTVANIDPTKLKRAAFIGAASAIYLANLSPAQAPDLWDLIRGHAMERWAAAMRRARRLDPAGPGEAGNILRFQAGYEEEILASIGRFGPLPEPVRARASAFLDTLGRIAGADAGGRVTPEQGEGAKVYTRSAEPKGPMSGFGYDYLEDRLRGQGLAKPDLPGHDGLWGAGGEYAYEALNLVDGKRSVARIRDDLAAIYGPVPLEKVAAYLGALQRIGVLASR